VPEHVILSSPAYTSVAGTINTANGTGGGCPSITAAEWTAREHLALSSRRHGKLQQNEQFDNNRRSGSTKDAD
jgi:hypothetical protein